ncbi:hypothetical protein ACP70R_036298 [Stipagrostis hirtigluma subsp. patula]
MQVLVDDISGTPVNALPVQLPEAQYTTELFHKRTYWGEPFGSSSSEKIPGAGSPRSFQLIIRLTTPVFLLRLSLFPGSHVSVKSSKLCHITIEVLDSWLTTRFPVSSSTATVELEDVFLILVDQIGDLDWLTRRARFPSSEMIRFDETGSDTGFSLLATHTIVCPGILLYQIPMYQLPFDPCNIEER